MISRFIDALQFHPIATGLLNRRSLPDRFGQGRSVTQYDFRLQSDVGLMANPRDHACAARLDYTAPWGQEPWIGLLAIPKATQQVFACGCESWQVAKDAG